MNKYKDDSDIITIPINITQSGLPSLWEEGGKWDSYGEATLIAGSAANKKNGLYYKYKVAHPNGKQALVKISENNIVMYGRCTNSIKDTIIIIRKIYKINLDEKAAYLKLVYYGKPENVKDKMYYPMIHVMLKKLQWVGCKRGMYVYRQNPNLRKGKTEKTFKQVLNDMSDINKEIEDEFESLFNELEDYKNDGNGREVKIEQR